jgi:hypothetical protein
MNAIKYHKVFGEVEVLNSDTNFTTILIVSTGEQKKLASQYANLQDSPFEKVSVKKVKHKQRELTQEEKDRSNAMVEKEMKDAAYIATLNGEQRLIFRAERNRRTLLS